MKKMLLAILFVIGATVVWAIQPTSYRIKAMGENLQGIVEDEYTDMIANPARVSEINKNKLYGTPPRSLPASLSLFTNSNWGFITELNKSASGNSSFSTNRYYSSAYWQINDYIYQSEYESEQFNIGIFKSIPLKYYSIGFAFIPERNMSVNNYFNESNYEYRKIQSDEVIYNSNSSGQGIDKTESINSKIVIGYNQKIEKSSIKDIVINLNMQKNKVLTLRDDYSSQNNDPDNNGKNYYDNSITTPSYSNSFTETKSDQDPEFMLGIGIEYRIKKIEDDKASKGVIIGLSWQPSEINQVDTKANQYYSVSGVNITSSTYIYSSTITGNSNLYKTYIAWGRSIKLQDSKFLLAYALRSELSFNEIQKDDTSSISYSESVSREYTGSLGLTSGVEYNLFSNLALRTGVTVSFTGSVKDENITQYKIQSKRFNQSTIFATGFGYKPFDYLSLDIYTTGNILSIYDLQLQAKYMF
ncbi:MAG: hypothetical protein A2252_12255 [Elusimicrobia bacterium RIFOXYA2_FULL_39_19]|nr:MAG: hypothetical protein A2252_12255 [Elusimicrobia bacterium RIFOXYA2_FULL_39_19]